MSRRGPPGLDLMNRTQSGQHRGRWGVGVEILIWSEGGMGCQVYQKWGKGHVERPWGPSWAESLWSHFTNYGGIDGGDKAFSWGASIHLLEKPGRKLEVVLQWPHHLEGWCFRMRSYSHLAVVCVYLPLIYLSGVVGRYILKLERRVGIFDIGGLRNSPKLQFKTWREVVCHICRFSRLRRTLRGLPLVSFRPFLGKCIGSLIFSRRPHGW